MNAASSLFRRPRHLSFIVQHVDLHNYLVHRQVRKLEIKRMAAARTLQHRQSNRSYRTFLALAGQYFKEGTSARPSTARVSKEATFCSRLPSPRKSGRNPATTGKMNGRPAHED